MSRRGVTVWSLLFLFVFVFSVISSSTTLAFSTTTVTRHGFLFPRTATVIKKNPTKDAPSSPIGRTNNLWNKHPFTFSSSSALVVPKWFRSTSPFPSYIRQHPWKSTLLLGFVVVSMMQYFEARRARQRQALDATSEWSRYAQNPAARGRAVMMIGLRLLPYWLRYKLTFDKEKKKQVSTQSGRVFSDELLKLGPLYIKLGQIFSCRENLLPTAWVAAMERLQDRVPAQSGEKALELAYTAASGKDKFEQLFDEFDDVPLAAASLGQVHRATLRATGAPVAMKLQRPNLRQIYDQDLALLTKIASMVDKLPTTRDVGGVSQSWTAIFDDAKEILYREIDYRDEAENAARFNRDFGLGLNGTVATTESQSLDGEPLPSAASWLRAPAVYQNISTEQLLVMEYVPSLKITKATNQTTLAQREELANSLARTYLRCFCTNRFFSTDPHPGNLGVEFTADKDVRLVMYDFGQACELQTPQAEGILNVIEAIVDMDSDKCVDAFEQMGVLKDNADLVKVRAKVQDNFETGKITVQRKKLKQRGYQFKEKQSNNETATTNNATATTTKVKDSEVMGFFTLPAEYAFVARALTQMDGVGKTLDPDFDFISSAAPYIVEIKGASNYLQDEWKKWLQSVKKQLKV
mmetsp:Transcript_22796/g.34501  ORF Transcript_22796/g.34501 Transcript_22796/m.34501 type:complete len:636 (+) Transcript_22796:141-2048(+)